MSHKLERADAKAGEGIEGQIKRIDTPEQIVKYYISTTGLRYQLRHHRM